MRNVQRWSALGVGVCAALMLVLVLVSGCGKGNGNGFGFGGSGSGGGGAAPTSAAASGANQGGGGSGSGFGQCQASGATEWIDVDNNAYADDTKLTSPSIPGVWMFAIETPSNDGVYTYAGFGRFGKIVMEVYAYGNQKDDPYAENQLATTAATQAGILKRASS